MESLVEAAWTSDVKGVNKFVLVALCRYVQDDRMLAMPKIDNLVTDTGLSRSTVKRALGDLRDHKAIRFANKIEFPQVDDWKTQVYRVTLNPRQVNLTPQGVNLTGSERTGGGSQRAVSSNPSSTPNGVEEKISTPKPTSPRRTSAEAESLRVYFVKALARAQAEYGAVVIGVVDKSPFRRQMDLRLAAGLTAERLRQMMDLYVARPSAWNKNIPPWRDFVSLGTQTRLANLVSEPGNSDGLSLVREVVRDFSGMSREQRFYWMRYDALPQFDKDAWDRAREQENA